MEKIIENLSTLNLKEIRAKYFNGRVIGEGELTALKNIKNESSELMETRLSQLALIARMMQICSEDSIHGNIGGFTIEDTSSMGFFFEAELNNLTSLHRLGEDARFFSEQAKAVEVEA